MGKGEILDWSKLKTFADDKINVTIKFKFDLQRVENISEKGVNVGTSIFSFFHQCFQKASFQGSLKVVIVW